MNTLNKRVFLLLSVVAVFAAVSVVSASSTIGTNIDTGGDLTVTGTTNLGKTNVSYTSTPGANTFNSAILSNPIIAPTVDQTNGLNFGVYGSPALDTPTTHTVSHLIGVEGAPYTNANVLLNNLIGVSSDPEAYTGTVDNLMGYQVNLLYSDAPVTTAAGFWNQTPTLNSTVGTYYGMRLDSPGGSGTYTNVYGLYLADHSVGTNNWNIYAAGTNSRNFFAGKVGIGTTTPQTQLHVSSGASATTTVTIGELGLSSSKSCVNMNRSNGLPISFYFNAAGVMVVETNYCR